jgi:hypothetical protein
MPEGLGFDMEHHVIIFVNLLTFFDQGEMEYQVEYPLTGGNEREGVLNKDTMKDAIDASIERGHIAEIVLKGYACSYTAQTLPCATKSRARFLSLEPLHGSP